MKNIVKVFAVALAFSAQLAMADFYVGGGINVTSLDVDTGDDSDVVPAIFVGWKPIKFFAVEGGYYDLGKYDKVDVDTWTLSAVGILPLAILDIYGKLGLADVSLSGADVDGESDPFYALGANINITSLIDLYAEVQRIAVTDDTDLDMIGAGIRFVF